MKHIIQFNKKLNMIFVRIVLIFFYFSAFGMAKALYIMFHKRASHKDSYWISHIEKPQQINYASAY